MLEHADLEIKADFAGRLLKSLPFFFKHSIIDLNPTLSTGVTLQEYLLTKLGEIDITIELGSLFHEKLTAINELIEQEKRNRLLEQIVTQDRMLLFTKDGEKVIDIEEDRRSFSTAVDDPWSVSGPSSFSVDSGLLVEKLLEIKDERFKSSYK